MEKEHATKAQITIPAAQKEQEASREIPQHYEQPRLVAADGKQFVWPESKPQASHREIPIYLKTLNERGTVIVAAQELFQANQQLQQDREVYAEEYHRQNAKDAVERSRKKKRDTDPQGYLDERARYMRDYRAKKSQEAAGKPTQETKGNQS